MPVCDFETLAALAAKVVEASPDAKIVIDENGSVVIFNAQAEFLFGYARSEIEGQPIEKLLPAAIKDIHVAHRSEYFREPKTREMGFGKVLKGLHRNGMEMQVQIKLAPMVVAGAGVFALAVVRRVKEEAPLGT